MVAPTISQIVSWLVFPMLASVMLLATTNYVCADVSVVPFLWVIPLALYLITFIIAFDHPRWYRRILTSIFTLIAIYGVGIIRHNQLGEINFYFDVGILGNGPLFGMFLDHAVFEEVFGPLSKTLFFEYRTIEALAAHFLEAHPERMRDLLSAGESGAGAGGAVRAATASVAERQRAWRLSTPVSAALPARAAAPEAATFDVRLTARGSSGADTNLERRIETARPSPTWSDLWLSLGEKAGTPGEIEVAVDAEVATTVRSSSWTVAAGTGPSRVRGPSSGTKASPARETWGAFSGTHVSRPPIPPAPLCTRSTGPATAMQVWPAASP